MSEEKKKFICGDIYFLAKMFSYAIKCFETALSSQCESAIHRRRLGLLLLTEGDLDKAYIHLKQAISLNPQDALVYLALGEIDFRRQHYNESINYLRKSLKFVPNNEIALSLLAKAYLEHGEMSSFIRVIKRLKDLPTGNIKNDDFR
jgi:tetratricopeptide (TPR) repeat protein